MSQRGFVQGLMFSGARFGAAFTLPVVAWMVSRLGWRPSFVFLGLIGVGWAAFWFWWFRDDPSLHPRISEAEREMILGSRQEALEREPPPAPLTTRRLFNSRNVWLLMGQYFCSNFTFFFSLSWLFPYLKSRYALGMVEAGFYASVPPLAGAFGNWVAGALIDSIYRRGRWLASRRTPAVAGFILAAIGLLACSRMATPSGAILCLALAVFGADMTIAPSWTVCIDIGRTHAGTVSGTMNMAGNLGSFVTALAFPYLLKWTGSNNAFFYAAAALDVAAIAAWYLTRPDQRLETY
jgi:ACS family glucarate transporter-like MFS transporter